MRSGDENAKLMSKASLVGFNFFINTPEIKN
jgi:hypothetical protein